MPVDAVQLSHQSNGKLHHDADLRRLPLPVLPIQSAPTFDFSLDFSTNVHTSTPLPDVSRDVTVHLVRLLSRCPAETRSRHVRAADGFDLLYATELRFRQQLQRQKVEKKKGFSTASKSRHLRTRLRRRFTSSKSAMISLSSLRHSSPSLLMSHSV